MQRILFGAWVALLVSACTTVDKNGKKSEFLAPDELPKSPRSAPLDPAYVDPARAKDASLTEYRQALARSHGFIFNLRILLVTEPYAKLWKKEAAEADRLATVQDLVKDRTCFRFEYDTFDKGAAKVEGWEAAWIPGILPEPPAKTREQARNEPLFKKDEVVAPWVAPPGAEPLALKFDADSVDGADEKKSLTVRGSFCSNAPLNTSPPFTVALVRKYEKKLSPVTFEWTEWKPGISSAPIRRHW